MTPLPAAPALSVIIPAYNERERLGPRLEQVLAYLRAHHPDFELIVVDDGSQDDTAGLVRPAAAADGRVRLIAYQPNQGKGYAVRTGMLASRGAAVLFMDADLSTPLEEIPGALARLREAEVVIGSRDRPGAEIAREQPVFRRLASEIFRLVRVLMIGLGDISDTQCGFKAYRGDVARQLYARARIDRFMFDIEILYLARLAGLRIEERPVRWADAPGSKVRFWEGLVNMVRDLWRIRRLHRGPLTLAEAEPRPED